VLKCISNVMKIEFRTTDPQIEIWERIDDQRIKRCDQDPLSDIELSQGNCLSTRCKNSWRSLAHGWAENVVLRKLIWLYLEKKGPFNILLDNLLLALPSILDDLLHRVNEINSKASRIVRWLDNPYISWPINHILWKCLLQEFVILADLINQVHRRSLPVTSK